MFGWLVVEQGRPLPRDGMAEAPWDDAPPATRENALPVPVSTPRALHAHAGLEGARALTVALGLPGVDAATGGRRSRPQAIRRLRALPIGRSPTR